MSTRGTSTLPTSTQLSTFASIKNNRSFSHLARLIGFSSSKVDIIHPDEDGDDGDEREEGDVVEEEGDEESLMWDAQVGFHQQLIPAS